VGSRPLASNPLAAGTLHQLLAPVKLRPFKSAYHVRAGDQLRLFCHAQRAYPEAQITWYIGNRALDADFLREHPNEFQLVHYQAPSGQAIGGGAISAATVPGQQQQQQQQPVLSSAPVQLAADTERLVEINPIPAHRHQMQLTANGRGSWMEFRQLRGPNAHSIQKYNIESNEQQAAYMRMKLAQLNGQNMAQQQAAMFAEQLSPNNNNNPNNNEQLQQLQHQQQTHAGPSSAISMLVINKLDPERHSSRYSCRATTRANTDEVTTVIKVKGKSAH